MRIPLCNYSIALALSAFYWPRRALLIDLWLSLIDIGHILWLPPLPACLHALLLLPPINQCAYPYLVTQ
jgi:hypothetical protein